MQRISLICLLISISLSVSSDEIYNDSWALVIGINKYNKVSHLDYAVEDAYAVTELLSSKMNFPRKNIITLTDGDASLDNIKNNLHKISTGAGKNDRVLIFFAGHGMTEELPGGGDVGYLMPIDGDRKNLFSTALAIEAFSLRSILLIL